MDSSGFKNLHEATGEVLGESKPFSICGSLPLVGDLQKAGFDIQVMTKLIALVIITLIDKWIWSQPCVSW